MSKYTVNSEKVGEVGAPFEPAEGVNVHALLEGGFISESGKAAKKSGKLDTTSDDQE